MNEEILEMFRQYIKDNLRIDVVSTTVYNDSFDNGQMYQEIQKIELILDKEIISEVYL